MSTRRALIAGNWKMHKTPPEAVALVKELLALGPWPEDRDVLVAPPFPALVPVAEAMRGTGVLLGAQNLHWEREGAFTGEVSAEMLRAAGCSHVIVGHSERRQLFGETDEIVARKAAAALGAGLHPIICIGETLEEREAGATLSVVERQIRAALGELAHDALDRVTLAYEPVWAIGTGRVASPEQAQEVHAFARRIVAEVSAPTLANAMRILYGGSVKPDNVDGLMRQPDIDGALVGGASLKAADFDRIVRFEG